MLILTHQFEKVGSIAASRGDGEGQIFTHQVQQQYTRDYKSQVMEVPLRHLHNLGLLIP